MYKIKETKPKYAMKKHVEAKDKMWKYMFLVFSRQAGKGKMNMRKIKSTYHYFK